MMLATRDGTARKIVRLSVLFNRANAPVSFTLPAAATWRELTRSGSKKVDQTVSLPARSAMFYLEN
jgi:glycogen operon protein